MYISSLKLVPQFVDFIRTRCEKNIQRIPNSTLQSTSFRETSRCPTENKVSLLSSLLHGPFNIYTVCSHFELFHELRINMRKRWERRTRSTHHISSTVEDSKIQSTVTSPFVRVTKISRNSWCVLLFFLCFFPPREWRENPPFFGCKKLVLVDFPMEKIPFLF